ncbi:MAG: methylated-DNA--[protein]-cysteine S-methyltransferase [Methylomonas sp.]|jgi:methylated-DNA-[protein]-cysteine S-methyltransferase|uniref:methylated-DNA--[protein]-cysteine S-methyltransferase n=1 Tax=Methylomonas sp. TaxID=418 RepID=UPI0025EBE325|nr:methylated-DNA--[protein]-cysteine S-methyltransferase [Methylomonas sp.]MCK9605213.1 methylated-DNA--[protein]-cysteine S-methyltransferase [Methylomonas sp.]
MSIQIVWQHETFGRQIEHRVPVLNAELVLTRIGDVIIDASWQTAIDRNICDESTFVKQVRAYLMDPRRCLLEVQLLERGTAYSQKIWQALLNIPFGDVISYSALADKLGSGPRAVAQACKNNPYAGIIPCHRVVSKNGIGGFMGQSQGEMIELKRQLLAYERSMFEFVK